MKSGTEKKTVMYIQRLDRVAGRETTVSVLLEPIVIQWDNFKIYDIGPDSDQSAKEETVPLKDFQRFVQGAGYVTARDYVGMVTDCEKRQ